MGDKHITMIRDDSNHEVWSLAKDDHHIVPKHTILGAFGSGNLSAHDASSSDVVPFKLPNGDKTVVQIVHGSEDESRANPGCGTLYTLATTLEKKAASKGVSLIITAYGQLVPEGVAGKHQYTFQWPEGHPKHKAMDYFLSAKRGKPGPKPSSGMFRAPR